MKRMTRPRLASLLLAGVAALGGCLDRAPAPVDPLPREAGPFPRSGGSALSRDYVPGRLVVRFTAGAADAAAGGGEDARILKVHGARLRHRLRLTRTWLLDVPTGQELAIAQALAASPDVELAEPDWVLSVQPCGTGECEAPGTPLMATKWELHNDGAVRSGGTVVPTGKADADIDWLEAYDHLGTDFRGSAVVAILDTGIRRTHQDLDGKVIGERNFLTSDAAQVGNASDDSGHGTQVAGLVAAHGRSGAGMLGVGYAANIKLLAAKVCDARGTCLSSHVAAGIVWATDNGANVLNLSFSGLPTAQHGPSLIREALDYARSKNVLPVCASGNHGYGALSFPARFESCAAVGATNWSDARTAYSNHGPGIDLVAPGGEQHGGLVEGMITSTTHQSDQAYVYSTGTSLAAPQVSGLAALLYATGLSDADRVLERLRSAADDLGAPGYDEEHGHGRINVYRALTGESPEAPPVAVAGTGYAANEGDPILFDGSASRDPNGKALRYAWSFGDGRGAEGVRPRHAYADDGTYTVTLTVTDPSGLSHTAATTAVVANVAPRVSAALRAHSILSGATAELSATLADPGADALWDYAIHWGAESARGTLSSASEEIRGTRRFCAAGSYPISVEAKDKDGAAGSASTELAVRRIGLDLLVAPETLRLRRGGRWIDVTVLGTPTLDAAGVDVATVALGDGHAPEAAVAARENGRRRAELADVNGDGRADLIVRFEREQVVDNGDLKEPATRLVLRANLLDGCRQVEGASEVSVAP